jgi:hypothetical protein
MENEFNALYSHILEYKPDKSTKWYNEVFTPTLSKMVSQGFKINNEFREHFKINEKLSVNQEKIYGWYNYCTTTGRPTNNFNGVNFSALKHDTGERDGFEASNDILIEMDYEGFHPRIIGHLIQFPLDTKGQSIHSHLAEMYFETKDITPEMYKKSKELTFQQMYGGINKKYLKHEYFAKTQQFINVLWETFNTQGYVETAIAKRRLLKGNYKNITPQKLFNYYIQAFETEYNFTILSKLFRLLEGKKSKITLYVYDSILIDFALEDGKETFLEIKNTISSIFPIKIKQGTTYSSLKAI